MKILLVYPECPDSFWSMKHIMKLFSKKAYLPPLGLMSVSALLPDSFEKKLIDLNVTKLDDKDILWADYVFISAMIVQKESSLEVIQRCKALGVKTVAGGPIFTSLYKEFSDVDHFILNEGEVTIPMFLEDLEKGELKKLYTSEVKPDLKEVPVPHYHLIDSSNYSVMPVQFSRGCPFDCEFCDIVNLNGRIPRSKTPEQIILELEAIHNLKWTGDIFFVDDNFIGDKNKTKKLLIKLIEWRKKVNFKPLFFTEISINAADDEELLDLMSQAGFCFVFIGIETPSMESLKECNKYQNQNRNMFESVRMFHRYGMEVSAGFIVGFDSDDETIFERQLEFIQQAGIPKAMIQLLQALPGTKLYNRLEAEGRLTKISTGGNQDSTINFVPKMEINQLISGYNNLIYNVYSPKLYYARILNFLKNYKPVCNEDIDINFIPPIIKALFILGFLNNGKRYFWKLMITALFKYPKSFHIALENAMFYIHFAKVFNESAFVRKET